MLGIHAASGTLYSLFILQYSSVYTDQLELVFRLLVRLQFMYFQYNVYLSIVVRTNIVFLPRPAGGEAACRAGPKIVLDHVRMYIYIYIYIYICLCAYDFLTTRCIRS